VDIVRNFLARYEQTREEEMSLEEYLDSASAIRWPHATASARVLADRSLDLLLIDDVQFFANKDRAKASPR
jgi:chromosomal replication initiation ATPase DnaA